MKRRWSEMRYSQEFDRWVVVLGSREYGLHCGESFDLNLGAKSILCQLELDRQQNWYIVVNGVRFNLRKSETYKIAI